MLIHLLAGWVGAAHAQSAEEPAPAPSSDTPAAPEAPPAPPAEPPPDLSDLDDFLANAAPPPPPPATVPSNAFNPRMTAFGDVFATLGLDEHGVMPGSTLWLRSLELDIRADVDPFAKAVAVLALHQEPPALEGHAHEEEEAAAEEVAEEEHGHDAFVVAPEEVYIDLVALPAGLSARIGQFRQPFGVTNRAHPHDWPWPGTPLPMEEVLGEEGLADVGLTAEWRVPNPWQKGLTLTAGALSGTPLDPEGETAIPAWIGRAEYFDHWGPVELGLGASAYGLQQSRLQGADLMLRWRKSSWRSVVLLGEAFQAVEAGEAGDLGWTASLQLQPTRPLYWGLRVDGMGDQLRFGTWLSGYTSEFLRLRGGVLTDQDLAETQVDLQLTFVWGSHPVEPYWVNR